MVKCLPEFECFTVFLKKKSNIRRSKVTDYAALKVQIRSRKKVTCMKLDALIFEHSSVHVHLSTICTLSMWAKVEISTVRKTILQSPYVFCTLTFLIFYINN